MCSTVGRNDGFGDKRDALRSLCKMIKMSWRDKEPQETEGCLSAILV